MSRAEVDFSRSLIILLQILQVRLVRFEAYGTRILTGIVNNEEDALNRDKDDDEGEIVM